MAFSGFNIVMAGIGLLSILVIQGVLSSRKNSSLGLFLPATSFIFSIFIIVYFKKFVGDHGFKGYETLGWYGLQFFLANVPTAILLIIYSMFKYDPDRDDTQSEDLAEEDPFDVNNHKN